MTFNPETVKMVEFGSETKFFEPTAARCCSCSSTCCCWPLRG